MAKSPRNEKANVPPTARELRATQPVPTAPPPEANQQPVNPAAAASSDATSDPVQASRRAGQVQRADVAVTAQAGVEHVPEGNTPLPEGVPIPEPVIDKVTVTKQARTYVDDAAVVANHRIAPADSAMIDQIISQKFDAGVFSPEQLAEETATELGLNPSWNDASGLRSLKISP